MGRADLHLRLVLHEVNAIGIAVGATPAAVDFGLGFECRPLLQERGAKFFLDLVGLVLPVDELPALQRY
jgi:hypothetical protein